ncbi:hypothetical protein B0O99DRAFT_744107 [Bisporella sp. PMI_857]|nr:hypothetical protein B0O99DRAFT_744107 [Bisporella sp. PMI_857]
MLQYRPDDPYTFVMGPNGVCLNGKLHFNLLCDGKLLQQIAMAIGMSLHYTPNEVAGLTGKIIEVFERCRGDVVKLMQRNSVVSKKSLKKLVELNGESLTWEEILLFHRAWVLWSPFENYWNGDIASTEESVTQDFAAIVSLEDLDDWERARERAREREIWIYQRVFSCIVGLGVGLLYFLYAIARSLS